MARNRRNSNEGSGLFVIILLMIIFWRWCLVFGIIALAVYFLVKLAKAAEEENAAGPASEDISSGTRSIRVTPVSPHSAGQPQQPLFSQEELKRRREAAQAARVQQVAANGPDAGRIAREAAREASVEAELAAMKAAKKKTIRMDAKDMMFCTQCGRRILRGSRFCEYCGAPVKLSDEELLLGSVQRARRGEARMAELREGIADEKVRGELTEILEALDKILGSFEKEPELMRRSGVRSFLDVYLPRTFAMIEKYCGLEQRELAGEKYTEARVRVGESLATIAEALRKTYQDLFSPEVMDVYSDAAALEDALLQKGYDKGE
ncbi:MAG: 5-bromo-4-chloroindolyl phosphate hydrolysis family protein [Lachnospiraceae bacterium]|nr:5-bromo-4-chloroindolyl phosphate hydrolysis family protein [Lachnospiraceae bacterium]